MSDPRVDQYEKSQRQLEELRAFAEASHQRLETLLEHVSDVLLFVDDSGRLLWASPSMERVSGRRVDDVLGVDGIEFVHPEDQALALERLSMFVQGDEPDEPTMLRFLHADDTWRWQEILARRVPDDTFGAPGLLLCARDVSDRVAAQRALAANEARFRALVQHAADVVVVLDADARITYASPSIEQVFGYSPTEIVGGPASQFVEPEDLGIMEAAFRGVVEEGTDSEPTVVIRGRHADGSARWVEAIVADHLDQPEIQGVVATCRDVTRRVHAERALQASEKRFRALVQNASDGIVVVDAEGNVGYASPPVERLFGRPVAEVEGSWGFEHVHPDDRAGVRYALADLVQDPTSMVTREFRVQGTRGEWYWVEATVVNLLDDEAVRGIVANVRDITDRKRLEADLHHAATHDPLTGLANRSLLLDRLETALGRRQRNRRVVGVMFVDLDGFKPVNDRFGHKAGDAILATLARRLRGTVRPGDSLGRWGGDEFLAICEDLESRDEAVAIAERLRETVSGPLEVEGTAVQLGASVGVALSGPRSDAESLIRDADAALYAAKESGRGCTEVVGHPRLLEPEG